MAKKATRQKSTQPTPPAKAQGDAASQEDGLLLSSAPRAYEQADQARAAEYHQPGPPTMPESGAPRMEASPDGAPPAGPQQAQGDQGNRAGQAEQAQQAEQAEQAEQAKKKADPGKLSMGKLLEWFSKFGTKRVTDLHIKVGAPPVFRIDGNLKAMTGPPLDLETVYRLAQEVIREEEWGELESNRSMDSSFEIGLLQYRLNAFYDKDGLALAMRALNTVPPPIDEIGFPNEVWKDVVNRKAGLVLITGITGAGKSTTIAAMINYIAQNRACRIITLEDPVEYRLTSGTSLISQRELGRDVPSFERGVRDCLREDPDVIFVGEMRDRESAAWTLSAAETGHLVFSTLHTRDARGSITRILDTFPENRQDEVANQLSLGLSHIMCQKLIPRKDGQGRVVAMEIMTNGYATANLIRQRKTEQLYSVLQTKTRDIADERMCTMEHSLAQLVATRQVDPEEALKWANSPAEFYSALRHMRG